MGCRVKLTKNTRQGGCGRGAIAPGDRRCLRRWCHGASALQPPSAWLWARVRSADAAGCQVCSRVSTVDKCAGQSVRQLMLVRFRKLKIENCDFFCDEPLKTLQLQKLCLQALRSAPHQSDVLTVIGSQVLVEPPQPRSDVAPHSRDHTPARELNRRRSSGFGAWVPVTSWPLLIAAKASAGHLQPARPSAHSSRWCRSARAW
jgi:hypothetical protein